LIVATPNNLNNGCLGTLAAAPGATAISLVNGSLAADASCTISLDLQVTAPGVLTSPPVTLSSNQAPDATAAPINLTVTVPPPTFTMAYIPSTSLLQAGGAANGTLAFTITNNAGIPLTNLAFNHALPTVPNNGLQVSAAGALTPTCGPAAVLTPPPPATPTTAIIQFTGGSVAPGQTCTVTIPVQTLFGFGAVGDTRVYVSTPVTLTSAQAAPVTAGPATWTVVRQQ
jgi:hypothetical protein